MDQFRLIGESFNDSVVKRIRWTVRQGTKTGTGKLLTQSKCVY